jgi:hypothetical protein
LIVAGHQPNYLPWLGFFDKIRQCDVFIIEDNVQYEQQGFTNRNKIKTEQGQRWLTVPIEHVGKRIPINEVRISSTAEPRWAERHWLTLKFNYCRAPFWNQYCDFFEETYKQKWTKLIDLNIHLIKGIMVFLKIDKPLVMASTLGVEGKKGESVIAKTKALGGTTQLSGQGAKEYLNPNRFVEEGIALKYQDFVYPTYQQLFGDFIPNLSVVDYLFCTGARDWLEESEAIKCGE